MKLNVYCGFFRNTVVKRKYKIINDFVYEIPCLECSGRGWWNYGPPGTEGKCIVCKGTGKQFLGL